MKRILNIALAFLFLIEIAAAQSVSEPDSFSNFVEEQWLDGNKRAVLQLAEKRLKENPNDLACLLITLDYATEFMELDKIRAVIPRIKATAATISSPNFDSQKSILTGGLEILEQLLPTITPEMVAAEAHKGAIKNKPMGSLVVIQALEADKIVPGVTSEERTTIKMSGLSPKPNVSSGETVPQKMSVTPTPTVARIEENTKNLPIVPAVIIVAVIVASVAFLLRRKSV